MSAEVFSHDQLNVVQWAAEECERQRSGELSVHWMLTAWNYAMRQDMKHPTEGVILVLGKLVEPHVNASSHFRHVNVSVGGNPKGSWQEVPRQMGLLIEAIDRLSPEEWYRCYEEVHPWTDGNGRTGSLLFNGLRGTLNNPIAPPDYWSNKESK